MQGTHKEEKYRHLEFWTWKSYVRPPILHNSKWVKTSRRILMEYIRIIGANKYQRGPTRWAQPSWECQGAQARSGGLWPPRPPPMPLFWYISHFDLEKRRRGLTGRSAAISRRNLGRSTFSLRRSDSAGGTSLPEGENHRHHHRQQLSHLGDNLHQHLQQHHLLSNPS